MFQIEQKALRNEFLTEEEEEMKRIEGFFQLPSSYERPIAHNIKNETNISILCYTTEEKRKKGVNSSSSELRSIAEIDSSK